MATKLGVCGDPDCEGKGGLHLLKDLEELCTDLTICKVECVDGGNCGKGPNVELLSRSSTFSLGGGETRKIFTGLTDFKKVEAFLKKNTNAKLDKKQLAVASAKFEARRTANMVTRLEKINEAMEALGGEVEAVKSEPKQAGKIFLMRARETYTGNPAAAFRDAQKAVDAMPEDGGARSMVALVLEKMGRYHEAYKALVDAIEYQYNLDVDEVLAMQERLEAKFKEEADREAEEKQMLEDQEARRLKEEEAKKKSAEQRKALAMKRAEEARKKIEAENLKKKELAEKQKKAEEEEQARLKAKEEEERRLAVEVEEAAQRKAAEEAYQTAMAAREEAEAKYDEVQKQLADIAVQLKERRERQLARKRAEEATLKYKLFACCRQERNGTTSDCEGDNPSFKNVDD